MLLNTEKRVLNSTFPCRFRGTLKGRFYLVRCMKCTINVFIQNERYISGTKGAMMYLTPFFFFFFKYRLLQRCYHVKDTYNTDTGTKMLPFQQQGKVQFNAWRVYGYTHTLVTCSRKKKSI